MQKLKEFGKRVSCFLPDSLYLRILYLKSHGTLLRLKDPKTVNEKIQYLKLYDRTDLHTKCADKYLVREYVNKKIGKKYLIPLIFSSTEILAITKKVIPDFPVIIKASHNSGTVYIIKRKEDFSVEKFRDLFTAKLKENYYIHGREWQYKHIQPRIVVEKLLMDENGNIPKDYKFHCFHGKVEFIQVDSDRFSEHTRNLYDRNWNLLPFNWSPSHNHQPLYRNGKVEERPEKLEEMIEVAEILAGPFKLARIDLYYTISDIYFGEITFHQESGTAPFFPHKYDRIYGRKLKLN